MIVLSLLGDWLHNRPFNSQENCFFFAKYTVPFTSQLSRFYSDIGPFQIRYTLCKWEPTAKNSFLKWSLLIFFFEARPLFQAGNYCQLSCCLALVNGAFSPIFWKELPCQGPFLEISLYLKIIIFKNWHQKSVTSLYSHQEAGVQVKHLSIVRALGSSWSILVNALVRCNYYGF